VTLARIGVLALQGDFAEHIHALTELGAETREVRLPKDLESLDGLIIPGGESTTIRRLLDLYGLAQPITDMASQGLPVWGTCAGMILMARHLPDDRPQPLGLMDVDVARNAFGRQVDSFEADINVPAFGTEVFKAVFIRAPAFVRLGDTVEVVARLDDGQIVAARQAGLFATSFHPELTKDKRFHSYFLDIVRDHEKEGQGGLNADIANVTVPSSAAS
jgi:5'-phosphate synthase pdxT subunit